MASGDAQKVWFPELIAIVRQAGDPALSIDALLCLRDRLDTTLQMIHLLSAPLTIPLVCCHINSF
jgi:hypothetical protein